MKINTKSILMGIAATSAMLGGVAFQSSPAKAVELVNGQKLNLAGLIDISESGGTFSIDFIDPTLILGIPPFDATGDGVSVETLDIAAGAANAVSIDDFITGIDFTDGSTGEFDLEKGVLQAFELTDTALVVNLIGNFVTTSGQSLGSGNLSLQLSGFGTINDLIGTSVEDLSFSSAIEVVPTPAAVLPALVGMGTAAFRKKKREGEEELALADAEEV